MEEKKKNVQAENLTSDYEKKVEELKNALEEMTSKREMYERWWLDAHNEVTRLEDEKEELRKVLNKVSAVAELYLKEKVWMEK